MILENGLSAQFFILKKCVERPFKECAREMGTNQPSLPISDFDFAPPFGKETKIALYKVPD